MTVFLRAFLARPPLVAAICLSSLSLFAPAATPLAGQDPQVRTLTQLGGIEVMVEDLDSAVQADGAVRFDSIEIGRAVEQRLADAGLVVLTDSQSRADPTVPFLDVEAVVRRDPASGDFLYLITVDLYQVVVLHHDVRLLAPTWESRFGVARVSRAAVTEKLRVKTLAAVDAFVRDYRAANPELSRQRR